MFLVFQEVAILLIFLGITIGTHNINHWATYAHHVNGKLSLSPSIDVSYPLGASFSISPSKESQFKYLRTSILDTLTVN